MLRLSDYAVVLKNSIITNHSIVFGCNCEIRYSGRAESFLPEGDRIILIKEDGTLLVHQPTGNNPINYMKAGSKFSVFLEGDSLSLQTKGPNGKEFMDINVKRIHFLNYQKLNDGKSIEIKGTEKDMADMIMKNPGCVEEGFRPFNREEHTMYGFIDVFGTDKDGKVTVVECKRYNADLAAVTQLRRYVEKIKESKGIDEVRGIIAAPKISSNALKMLENWGFKFCSVNPPNYMEKFDKSQQRLDFFGNS